MYFIILYYSVFYYIVLYYIIFYFIVLYCIILYHIILYIYTLYFIILYYICCTLLCYFNVFHTIYHSPCFIDFLIKSIPKRETHNSMCHWDPADSALLIFFLEALPKKKWILIWNTCFSIYQYCCIY